MEQAQVTGPRDLLPISMIAISLRAGVRSAAPAKACNLQRAWDSQTTQTPGAGVSVRREGHPQAAAVGHCPGLSPVDQAGNKKRCGVGVGGED